MWAFPQYSYLWVDHALAYRHVCTAHQARLQCSVPLTWYSAQSGMKRCLFTSPQKKSHGNYQKIEMNGSTNKTLSYLAHSQKAVPFSCHVKYLVSSDTRVRSQFPTLFSHATAPYPVIPFQPWLLVYLLHPLPSSVGSDGKMTTILELPRKQAAHNWLGSLHQSLHTSVRNHFPFPLFVVS